MSIISFKEENFLRIKINNVGYCLPIKCSENMGLLEYTESNFPNQPYNIELEEQISGKDNEIINILMNYAICENPSIFDNYKDINDIIKIIRAMMFFIFPIQKIKKLLDYIVKDYEILFQLLMNFQNKEEIYMLSNEILNKHVHNIFNLKDTESITKLINHLASFNDDLRYYLLNNIPVDKFTDNILDLWIKILFDEAKKKTLIPIDKIDQYKKEKILGRCRHWNSTPIEKYDVIMGINYDYQEDLTNFKFHILDETHAILPEASKMFFTEYGLIVESYSLVHKKGKLISFDINNKSVEIIKPDRMGTK